MERHPDLLTQYYAVQPESAVHLVGKGLAHLGLIVARATIATLARVLGARPR